MAVNVNTYKVGERLRIRAQFSKNKRFKRGQLFEVVDVSDEFGAIKMKIVEPEKYAGREITSQLGRVKFDFSRESENEKKSTVSGEGKTDEKLLKIVDTLESCLNDIRSILTDMQVHIQDISVHCQQTIMATTSLVQLWNGQTSPAQVAKPAPVVEVKA
jgi:hypothetical protein